MYCKVKMKYKFQHPECDEASRTQVTLCINLQNGYDAYNCTYNTRQTNTVDFFRCTCV